MWVTDRLLTKKGMFTVNFNLIMVIVNLNVIYQLYFQFLRYLGYLKSNRAVQLYIKCHKKITTCLFQSNLLDLCNNNELDHFKPIIIIGLLHNGAEHMLSSHQTIILFCYCCAMQN